MSYKKNLGPKKWRLFIELGKDENGKRKRKTKIVYCSESEANDKMRELENKYRNKKELNDDIKLKKHLREWLDHYSSNLAETTVESYRGQIEPYLIPELGEIKLKNLTTKIIDDHYAKMLDCGKKHSEGGLSKRTVEYQHTIFKKALDKAIDWNRLEENPAANADPPHSKNKNKDVDPYELIEILKNVDNEIYRDFFEFNLRTGLRRGEILGLKWRAIKWERQIISIMRVLTVAGNRNILKDLTKNDTSYTIPASPKTFSLLEKIKKREEKNKKELGKEEYKDDGFVFTWEDGKYISPSSITEAFKKYAKNTGYSYNLHDLRHGFSAIQINLGTHTKTLQKLLNHKSEEVTSKIYSHLLKGQKSEATQRIDEFF